MDRDKTSKEEAKAIADMARPKKPIDRKLVGGLAGVGCTNEEIATLLGCSHDTIERRFAGSLRKGRAKLKMSLRRQQVKKAKEGSVPMLIWLGKQYLDQRDRHEIQQVDVNQIYAGLMNDTDGSTSSLAGNDSLAKRISQAPNN
jgi:hypothetical protein